MTRKSKAGIAKRFAAAALAGCMLYCGGVQANAATLKDVFDEHYYADTNPDLKEAFGYNREALWQHFMKYGLSEGRNMNGLIDIVKYRETYSDLNAAFGDNWNAYLNHYLTFGVKEHRDTGTGTGFNALDYAGRYEDLQAAYGTNVLALWNHYRAFGATEGREGRDENIVQAEEAARAAEEAGEAEEASGAAETEESSRTRIERIELEDGKYRINEYYDEQLIKGTTYGPDGSIWGWCEYEYYDGQLIKSTYYEPDGSIEGWEEYKYNDAGYLLEQRRYESFPGEDGSCVLRQFWLIVYRGDANKTRVETAFVVDGFGNFRWLKWDNDGKVIQDAVYNVEDSILEGWSI